MMPMEFSEVVAFVGLTILRIGVPVLGIFVLGTLAKRIEMMQS